MCMHSNRKLDRTAAAHATPTTHPTAKRRYNLTEGVGSWCYMAPEVLLGQAYNERAGELRAARLMLLHALPASLCLLGTRGHSCF